MYFLFPFAVQETYHPMAFNPFFIFLSRFSFFFTFCLSVVVI